MSKWDQLQQLTQTPLGRADGEANLQVPFNAKPTSVIISVKNHSATVERKVLKAAVSYMGGTEQKAVRDHWEGMTSEAIQKEAARRDMNVYDHKVKPVKAMLPFDGKNYIIPPGKTKEDEPPKVTVPEGMWDLYMGNWERMNGSAQERNEELQRLATRFSGRENPAMQFDAQGNVKSGYLEFIREEVRPEAYALDREALASSDIEEV
jgi:hypothetical protein